MPCMDLNAAKITDFFQYKTIGKNSCLIALAFNLDGTGKLGLASYGTYWCWSAAAQECKRIHAQTSFSICEPHTLHRQCVEGPLVFHGGRCTQKIMGKKTGLQHMSLLAVGVLRITSSHRNVCVCLGSCARWNKKRHLFYIKTKWNTVNTVVLPWCWPLIQPRLVT